MRTLLSVGTCLLVGLIAVAAQEQQQQPSPEAPKQEEPIQGPTFRTGIDLVAIDVCGRRSPRPTGRGSARTGVRREDRRRGSACRVRRTDQGRCRGCAEAGCRQDRELLYEQPDAAERTADHHRRRPGEHPTWLASSGARCRGSLPRHVEPARPGGVRRLPGARAARELHQRQAPPAARDAGAGRAAAAVQGRDATTSACPKRSRSRSGAIRSSCSR